MIVSPQNSFQMAGLGYLLALIGVFLPGRFSRLLWIGLLPALVCNVVTVALRYHQAWPMLPMHVGATALPLCLGLLLPVVALSVEHGRQRLLRGLLLVLIVLLVGIVLCFPKDFYLPFLKSKTLLAHGFLWFGLAGKSCFAVSVVWALTALPWLQSLAEQHWSSRAMHHCRRWAGLGFVLWTLSMFSGELWSYLGWGTPVVWEDPALTMTMAVWFFYACLLHLHLTKTWTLKARAWYAALSGAAMLGLSCVPDLGPFRAPF